MNFNNSNSVSFILDLVNCNYSLDLQFLDKIQDDLEVDIYDAEDVIAVVFKNIITSNRDSSIINILIGEVYNLFIGNMVSEYGEDNLSEEDFSYCLNSLDSHINYKGEEFHTKEEFEDMFKDKEYTLEVSYSGVKTIKIMAKSLDDAKARALCGEYDECVDDGFNIDYVDVESAND